MIVDVNTWIGSWPFTRLKGSQQEISELLNEFEVSIAMVSPLDGVWGLNPHLSNRVVYEAQQTDPRFTPLPVIDPTIPTWREVLEEASSFHRCHWIRLIPTYVEYLLQDADELFDALAGRGMGVLVQVRMEDPRRHHPLAQVQDTRVEDVAIAASRYPRVKFILGGASWPSILRILDELRKLDNLFTDISQVDGLGMVRHLFDQGLEDKLLFGSHAPFFSPQAALAKVVLDLNEKQAERVLFKNARKYLFPTDRVVWNG